MATGKIFLPAQPAAKSNGSRTISTRQSISVYSLLSVYENVFVMPGNPSKDSAKAIQYIQIYSPTVVSPPTLLSRNFCKHLG
jgi:hypothetical protein